MESAPRTERRIAPSYRRFRNRKGWKALGYESFKEYGEKSLGYEKAYLTRLADAGEISLQLGYDPELPIGNPPPESQLRPLKSVPEEERKAIWEEAIRKAEEEGAKLTAKRVEEAVVDWKSKADSERQRREAAERALHQSSVDSMAAGPWITFPPR